jgi:hypothetical protein
MTLEDRIYGRALAMVGELTPTQDARLRCLSQAARKSLESRLRSGIRAEDCAEEFLAAGSLLAFAAFLESDSAPERFTAGEMTVQQGNRSGTAGSLRRQAESIMAPYTSSGMFLGV